MTDFEVQVCGKLSSLEFLIEVLLANNLAYMEQKHSDQFKADLLNREGYIRRGPVDLDQLQKIEEATQESLSNVVRKIAEREVQIRAAVAAL